MHAGGRDRELGQVEVASERVLRALRALDARRHASAPTLEREYQRALEAYFDVAERALGRVPEREEALVVPPMRLVPPAIVPPAIVPRADALSEVGAGDEQDEPTDDERARIESTQHARAAIAAHYAAARHALRLAREYRAETGSSGRRERECVEAVRRHRGAIRWLRLEERRAGEQLALPGLVKTRPSRADRVARSG